MKDFQGIIDSMQNRIRSMSKDDWEKSVAKAIDDSKDSWMLGDADEHEDLYFGMKTRCEVEEKRKQFQEEYQRMERRTDFDFTEKLSMIATSIRTMDWVLGNNVPLV